MPPGNDGRAKTPVLTKTRETVKLKTEWIESTFVKNSIFIGFVSFDDFRTFRNFN